jgi:hypothetical protein
MAYLDEALLTLLRLLKERNYRFVTVTPATHARITRRLNGYRAHSLEDVFGWSLPFSPGVVDRDIEQCLREGNAVEIGGDVMRSLIRVSTLHDCLFLHSAYPTTDRDAAFFGPDSYRFANLVITELTSRPPQAGDVVVDIGTGVGVGAIVVGQSFPKANIFMTEINRRALNLAQVNAKAAGIAPIPMHARCLDGINKPIDIAMANPPYIMDDQQRLYRNGGGLNGSGTTMAMARFTLPRLAKHGRFILYSGSAIVSGEDTLKGRLARLAEDQDCRLRYWELDPDVFGEELANPQYAQVDRIALIAAIFERV